MDELIENYARIPANQRRMGAFLLAAGLIAGYYFLYHQEELDRLDRAQRVLTQQQSQVHKKRSYVENMTRYEARFNELQSQLDHARDVLPDSPDVAQLLAQLGSKARQVGLDIDYFEPTDEIDQDFFTEILFQMKLRGSYHEIATFIDSIGKMDRIVNVAGITMEAPRTLNQKIVLQAGFVIKTYKFLSKDEEAQKKAGSKKKKG